MSVCVAVCEAVCVAVCRLLMAMRVPQGGDMSMAAALGWIVDNAASLYGLESVMEQAEHRKRALQGVAPFTVPPNGPCA